MTEGARGEKYTTLSMNSYETNGTPTPAGDSETGKYSRFDILGSYAVKVSESVGLKALGFFLGAVANF